MSRDKIRIGGLMRCCLETLDERTEPGAEGDEQACKYCSHSARFRDGAWEWNWPPVGSSGSSSGSTP